ncbi:MAG TPA: hypothetical protein VHW93_02850, partial [Acidimicrobiales bacterium]|nr:hypothetical protein [Acidimicrobiales bacterium]
MTIVGIAAGCGYLALPSASSQAIALLAVGALSVICVLVGVALHQPPDRTSWYLLAAGVACFTLGNAVHNAYSLVFHLPVPFPSTADALSLVGYLFVFAGILRLTRRP